MAGWRAWGLDPSTVSVYLWLAWFVGWETWGLARGGYLATYTAHLRPLFLSQPLTWWLGLGFYVWLGIHIFAPSLEAWLANAVAATPRPALTKD